MAFVSAGRVYLNYQVIRGATHRIIELLGNKLKQPPISPPASSEGHAFIKGEFVEGKIEFKNVTFGYNAGTDVLKNLSFNVNPGEWLLITGPSGCGKSTIASLLLGFYNRGKGEILIDRKPIDDYNIYELRKQIGFSAQEPVLFQGSIKENILFSEKNISTQRLEEILQITCLDEFINHLPDGINTIIGERGITIEKLKLDGHSVQVRQSRDLEIFRHGGLNIRGASTGINIRIRTDQIDDRLIIDY